jgi:hypothetical protein
MPEMILRSPWAAGLYFQWTQIFAYMGWPKEREERAGRLARYFAEALSRLPKPRQDEEHTERLIDQLGLEEAGANQARENTIKVYERFLEPTRLKYYDTFDNEFDGFRSFFLGFGIKDFPKAEVLTAGQILLIIRAIEVHHLELLGGGSIKKAAFLIEYADGRGGLIKNERDIREAWKNFKNVAHLSAAWHLVDLSSDGKFYETEELVLFLIIARDFQKFATSFYPHARKSTLLDSNEVWSVPGNLPLPEPVVPVAPPLHENDLAVLKEYRA